MAVPKKPTLPTKSKSPGRVTKNEAAYGKKYAQLAKMARKKVDIKGGTTTRAQAQAIKDARAKLQKMKKQMVGQGYGSISKTKNKAGGYSSHGIYKGLTGKRLPKKRSTNPPPP